MPAHTDDIDKEELKQLFLSTIVGDPSGYEMLYNIADTLDMLPQLGISEKGAPPPQLQYAARRLFNDACARGKMLALKTALQAQFKL